MAIIHPKYLLVSLAILPNLAIEAQSTSSITEGALHLGGRFGITSGCIESFDKTIIRDEWYPTGSYSAGSVKRMKYLLGVVGYYQPGEWWPAFELAVEYEDAYRPQVDPGMVNEASRFDFEYEDNFASQNQAGADSLRYKIWLNYSYINVGFMVNYPLLPKWKQVRISPGLGLNLGFNVTPRNLEFMSNHPTLGDDLQIAQNMSSVLVGRTVAQGVVGLQFDIDPGVHDEGPLITVLGRRRFGMSDYIRTEANEYNFVENRNTSNSWMFGIQVTCPLKPSNNRSRNKNMQNQETQKEILNEIKKLNEHLEKLIP
ncbi:MAG: hypothetical protein IPI72_12285 [Flavobacteriales bacterium]|nr:hypothetical protein [Flavobacteriales bacterium]